MSESKGVRESERVCESKRDSEKNIDIGKSGTLMRNAQSVKVKHYKDSSISPTQINVPC